MGSSVQRAVQTLGNNVAQAFEQGSVAGAIVRQNNRARSASAKEINRQKNESDAQIAAIETEATNTAAATTAGKKRAAARSRQVSAASTGRDSTILTEGVPQLNTMLGESSVTSPRKTLLGQ